MGSFCRAGLTVCREGDTAENVAAVSPYIGNISSFAPQGLPAVRLEIDYQMRCLQGREPCAYNVVPIEIWPLQSQQPVSASVFQRTPQPFSFVDSLQPTVSQSSRSSVTDTPLLMHTTFYRLPLNAEGFYVAFRSRGACVYLARLRISYLLCLRAQIDGVILEEKLASSADVQHSGSCNSSLALVPNPAMNSGAVAGVCSPYGNWTSVLGQCVCAAGWGRSSRASVCLGKSVLSL